MFFLEECLLSGFLGGGCCVRLCDPMDCSSPGPTVHGISQARIMEWVAIPVSRGSSPPGIKPASPDWQVDSLPLSHQGRPVSYLPRAVVTKYHKLGGLKEQISSMEWEGKKSEIKGWAESYFLCNLKGKFPPILAGFWCLPTTYGVP